MAFILSRISHFCRRLTDKLFGGVPALVVLIVILLTILVLFVVFIYTEKVRRNMIQYNRNIINTYSKLWSLALSKKMEGPELSILFEEVIEKADFPMVLAGVDGEPQSWRNIGIPEDDTSPRARAKIRKWIAQHKDKYPPVAVTIPGTDKVLAYIYFGESRLFRLLGFLPLAQAVTVFLLFLFGSFVYRRVRGYEQQSLWLGLAKEAAHQMGTPTSSLLGWIAMLREQIEAANIVSDEISKTLAEMERDVDTLSRTVVRFGQIGSVPELIPIDVQNVVKDVLSYLRQRLAPLRKNITVEEMYYPTPMVMGNSLLISWAIENLIRNSVDAIGSNKGTIWVAVRVSVDGSEIHVVISDNGKGIPIENQDRIFQPGFTTKKRGWGLGLSLAKRIVEDYHNGKLFLLESRPFEKTTFIIALPIRNLQ